MRSGSAPRLALAAVALVLAGGCRTSSAGAPDASSPPTPPATEAVPDTAPRMPEHPGAPLEQPEALARFRARLDGLARGEGGRLTVLQLGASHTAYELFAAHLRTTLQARYGDAGRGWVPAGSTDARYPPLGVERQAEGRWSVTGAVRAPPGGVWGLSGTRTVGEPGARLTWRFRTAAAADPALPAHLALHYLDVPGRGGAEVWLDGALAATLAPLPPLPGTAAAAPPTPRALELPALGAEHVLEVRALGPGPLPLLGASHALDRPGVVWDALGLPGASAPVADGFARAPFVAQLRARQPDLYVLFYGTNESMRASLDARGYRRRYRSLLGTLRQAAPRAECLLLGPTDRQVPQPGGRWKPAPSAAAVEAAVRQVAREAGCAFWSPRTAMGGPGSLLTWLEASPPLARTDGVHLTAEGYARLATLLEVELLPPEARAAPAAPRAR